jgi:hypothetical protein
MKQSSPWEADSHSASQEIPYGTQKFIILSQEPAAGLHPKPGASSPQFLTLFP